MADNSDFTKISSKLKEMTLQDKVIISEDQSDTTVGVNVFGAYLRSTPNSDSSPKGPNVSSKFTFDNVIGHLEDMLVDEDFHRLQNRFFEKYWEEFERNEENKHSYMTIFKEYTSDIEEFITAYLKERIVNFSMEEFTTELQQRKNSLEGEVFEVLLTLSDFEAFKELLLDYRAVLHVTLQFELTSGFDKLYQQINATVHRKLRNEVKPTTSPSSLFIQQRSTRPRE